VITALATDAKGQLWVGTLRGLDLMRNGRLVTGNDENRPRIRITDPVNAMCDDTEDGPWIGTPSRLVHLTATRDAVYALLEDHRGELWIDTFGGGLNRLCVMALTALTIGGYRLRIGRVRRREQELARLVEERTRQLEELNRELKRLAALDSVTGLANRRQFQDTLAQEWRRALRDRTPLALIMVDIDHFKAYNDGLGHQAGDDFLRLVARTLAETARRPGNLVARYGGGEFVLILRRPMRKARSISPSACG
jgi:predicted signal transduction protein with EAL and GGDEF domain